MAKLVFTAAWLCSVLELEKLNKNIKTLKINLRTSNTFRTELSVMPTDDAIACSTELSKLHTYYIPTFKSTTTRERSARSGNACHLQRNNKSASNSQCCDELLYLTHVFYSLQVIFSRLECTDTNVW